MLLRNLTFPGYDVHFPKSYARMFLHVVHELLFEKFARHAPICVKIYDGKFSFDDTRRQIKGLAIFGNYLNIEAVSI